MIIGRSIQKWIRGDDDSNSNLRPHRNRIYPTADGLMLELFRSIAKEPILMGLLSLWLLLAVAGVVVLSQRLERHVSSTITIPDLRVMGYSKAQLYQEFYHVIGQEGCTHYSTLAFWDMLVLIPAYSIALGTAWVHVSRRTYDKVQTRRSGYWNADRGASVVLPIALFDYFETLVQRHGCTLLASNQELSSLLVRLASAAVSMKWFLLILYFVSILDRLYKSYVGRCKRDHRTELPLWM